MKPSIQVGLIAGALIGVAVGVAGYTFIYAKGGSYLTNNPAACANCHVMQDHFDAWVKSTHRSVATCNDCHTPHNIVGKYLTKADNGFWHSFAFTSGNYPDPLRIKPRNRAIVEKACLNCHGEIVDAIAHPHSGQEALSCIRCHQGVGHPR